MDKKEILGINIKDDHIHLIFFITPRLSVFDVIRILKGKTAVRYFKSFPTLKGNITG